MRWAWHGTSDSAADSIAQQVCLCYGTPFCRHGDANYYATWSHQPGLCFSCKVLISCILCIFGQGFDVGHCRKCDAYGHTMRRVWFHEEARFATTFAASAKHRDWSGTSQRVRVLVVLVSCLLPLTA